MFTYDNSYTFATRCHIGIDCSYIPAGDDKFKVISIIKITHVIWIVSLWTWIYDVSFCACFDVPWEHWSSNYFGWSNPYECDPRCSWNSLIFSEYPRIFEPSVIRVYHRYVVANWNTTNCYLFFSDFLHAFSPGRFSFLSSRMSLYYRSTLNSLSVLRRKTRCCL